ncbi:MAG: hypothetical protein H0T41_06165, partial [Rhodobacteraceae bacterium]|nr:hypothetical protein [Paracoccaceae bacterium]
MAPRKTLRSVVNGASPPAQVPSPMSQTDPTVVPGATRGVNVGGAALVSGATLARTLTATRCVAAPARFVARTVRVAASAAAVGTVISPEAAPIVTPAGAASSAKVRSDPLKNAAAAIVRDPGPCASATGAGAA